MEKGKTMIRKCDVGKTLFYAMYNSRELPGFRYSTGKLTITDVQFNGTFQAAEHDSLIPQDFVNADRMFWRSWECERYCRRRNAQEFRKGVKHARFKRAS